MESFTNEIKKFWRLLSKKGKDNTIIVISVLLIIFIYKGVKDIFYSADFLNGFFQNLYSDLFVGLFVGIIIAFYFTRYMKEREKPILELWVEQDREVRFSKKDIDKYEIESKEIEKLGMVNQPIIGGILYSFRLSLLIGNIGMKTGRFIKISIGLEWDGIEENYYKFLYLQNDYKEPLLILANQNFTIGEWTKEGAFTGKIFFEVMKN